MDGIAFLTAGGVSLTNVAILGVATFVVSLLVAAAGPTGGMQLAATAATLPGPVVIPIHAWTTGFSALFRAVALRAHVDWRYVRPFVFASAIGAGVVVAVYSRILLPDLQAVVAIYIILSSIIELLGRGPRLHFAAPRPMLEGVLTGAASVVIGATGPLLMVLMKDHVEDRLQLSGTFSACLAFQHLFKIIAFGVIGVSIFEYTGVLVVVTTAAAVGTVLGSKLLVRIDESIYRRVLAVMLIIASVWILYDAIARWRSSARVLDTQERASAAISPRSDA